MEDGEMEQMYQLLIVPLFKVSLMANDLIIYASTLEDKQNCNAQKCSILGQVNISAGNSQGVLQKKNGGWIEKIS